MIMNSTFILNDTNENNGNKYKQNNNNSNKNITQNKTTIINKNNL